MIKKKISIALVSVMALTLFAACGAKAPAAPAAPAGLTTDVLVIGGGGAGLVSAITAAENGSNVILVEKMPMLGGNTVISATGITASDTKLHEAAGRPFTKEEHITRTMESGKNLADKELVELLVNSSSDAYDWLVSLGLKYKLHEKDNFWIIPEEGHYGSLLVAAYKTEIEKNKNITVMMNTKADELVMDGSKVVGAKVTGKDGKQQTITAKSVILATGGLNNAPEMIAEFNPKYKGIHAEMTTAGATGDGITMARKVGAKLVDMDLFQMRPLASNGNWYNQSLIVEEGKGGILVNKGGVRFADETMNTWDLGSEILKQEDAMAYIIFDEDVVATKDGKKAFEIGKGVKADTIEELAAQLGVDAAKLKATVEDYNNKIDPFNRKTLGKITTAPFYAVKTLPSSHYTMGGVGINKDAQVLNESGTVIEGLFAAGEVVGGLYGAGRVAGNNTLDDIVFGKIAGKVAAGK
jgi:flavocytochrome c